MKRISFDNTEVAFSHLTNKDLKRARRLFSLFNYPLLIAIGPKLTEWALKMRLPIKGLVRNTIFQQFCGGESAAECHDTAELLYQKGVGSILDYSVEGEESESAFDSNLEEIKRVIDIADAKDKYPFAVFKTTGIARFELLQKMQEGNILSAEEQEERERAFKRFEEICRYAHQKGVKIFVDAEESWIQDPIDHWATDMMKKFNREKVYIFNTLQMYRWDRLEFLKKQLEERDKDSNYLLGYKLVRGAYMEKERDRALEMDYPSPIQETKEDTDADFDEAQLLCAVNHHAIGFSIGTHNEISSMKLAEWMIENNIPKNHPNFWFAQLYGMSDNISFNLAQEGFNVAKYLPYGPILSVLPYLARRAVENSSVSGQVGRELRLILKEIIRRRKR
jgi:proline dehydrogenase